MTLKAARPVSQIFSARRVIIPQGLDSRLLFGPPMVVSCSHMIDANQCGLRNGAGGHQRFLPHAYQDRGSAPKSSIKGTMTSKAKCGNEPCRSQRTLPDHSRNHRIYQARTCSRFRNASAWGPCKIARVAIIPAWIHVEEATVTDRSGSTTGQPVLGSRICP
jgi:hypothetical protein